MPRVTGEDLVEAEELFYSAAYKYVQFNSSGESPAPELLRIIQTGLYVLRVIECRVLKGDVATPVEKVTLKSLRQPERIDEND
ncbi:hypothetical protein EVAR_86564_1 [Eumeta japonica]|uniref:Uncharacterized protein n=1 Tax=Eumeta variegata TaxID=151549 RepID=A0A4C2A2N7_EUMVA|nr:hypothetical protein EVAR_86564_1 [Eumeta japonica]